MDKDGNPAFRPIAPRGEAAREDPAGVKVHDRYHDRRRSGEISKQHKERCFSAKGAESVNSTKSGASPDAKGRRSFDRNEK